MATSIETPHGRLRLDVQTGPSGHYGIRANAVAPGVIGRVEAMPAFQKEASSS